jgi:hypothetical protein
MRKLSPFWASAVQSNGIGAVAIGCNTGMYMTNAATPPDRSHADAEPRRPDLAEPAARARTRAPVTLLLVAANVLVFLAMLANGAGWSHTSNAVR